MSRRRRRCGSTSASRLAPDRHARRVDRQLQRAPDLRARARQPLAGTVDSQAGIGTRRARRHHGRWLSDGVNSQSRTCAWPVPPASAPRPPALRHRCGRVTQVLVAPAPVAAGAAACGGDEMEHQLVAPRAPVWSRYSAGGRPGRGAAGTHRARTLHTDFHRRRGRPSTSCSATPCARSSPPRSRRTSAPGTRPAAFRASLSPRRRAACRPQLPRGIRQRQPAGVR
jgi:hypothetical protein